MSVWFYLNIISYINQNFVVLSVVGSTDAQGYNTVVVVVVVVTTVKSFMVQDRWLKLRFFGKVDMHINFYKDTQLKLIQGCLNWTVVAQKIVPFSRQFIKTDNKLIFRHYDTTYNDTSYKGNTYNDTSYNDTTYNSTTYNDTSYNDTTYNDNTYNDTAYNDLT